jgi:hypothetical protein
MIINNKPFSKEGPISSNPEFFIFWICLSTFNNSLGGLTILGTSYANNRAAGSFVNGFCETIFCNKFISINLLGR